MSFFVIFLHRFLHLWTLHYSQAKKSSWHVSGKSACPPHSHLPSAGRRESRGTSNKLAGPGDKDKHEAGSHKPFISCRRQRKLRALSLAFHWLCDRLGAGQAPDVVLEAGLEPGTCLSHEWRHFLPVCTTAQSQMGWHEQSG